jgi:hypothetical protein
MVAGLSRLSRLNGAYHATAHSTHHHLASQRERCTCRSRISQTVMASFAIAVRPSVTTTEATVLILRAS